MPILELGTGTNGTASNTVDSYYGPWSTAWAMGSLKTFSVTQKDGYRYNASTGTLTAITSNHAYVATLAMRISSETTPLATGRGRIWTSGGSHVAASSSVSIHQDSGTPISNQSFTMGTLLNPGTSYRFGFYISSGTSNSRVNYDWKTTSGVDIDVDTSSSATGSFTVNTIQKSGASLMVDVEYYTFPDAPTVTAGTNTTSSINFTINAPSTTLSGSITGYVVQYKLSTDTAWITDNSGAVAGSYSISGLIPGKVYDVRVAAKSIATEEYAAANSITDDVTGPYVSASYTVKTFGKKMTDSLGGNSGLTTIKRYVGPGLTTTDASDATITADADGYVNLTRAKRFDGTNWIDIS
jgi:hypothetical protein